MLFKELQAHSQQHSLARDAHLLQAPNNWEGSNGAGADEVGVKFAYARQITVICNGLIKKRRKMKKTKKSAQNKGKSPSNPDENFPKREPAQIRTLSFEDQKLTNVTLQILETSLPGALYRESREFMRNLMTFLGKIHKNPS